MYFLITLLRERIRSETDAVVYATGQNTFIGKTAHLVSSVKQESHFQKDVFGLFMAPLGWGLVLFVWGYALIACLIEDRVKLAGYKIFDLKLPGLLSSRWDH